MNPSVTNLTNLFSGSKNKENWFKENFFQVDIQFRNLKNWTDAWRTDGWKRIEIKQQTYRKSNFLFFWYALQTHQMSENSEFKKAPKSAKKSFWKPCLVFWKLFLANDLVSKFNGNKIEARKWMQRSIVLKKQEGGWEWKEKINHDHWKTSGRLVADHSWEFVSES